MQNVDNRYFWDGRQNLSDEFVIRRILEYAAFPELLKLPFDQLKTYLLHHDPDRLRTSEKRKQFLKVISPYLKASNSLEDAVFQLIEHYFAKG
jgi:hypothetical protein